MVARRLTLRAVRKVACLGLAGLVCALAATNASAGDVKRYPATFCVGNNLDNLAYLLPGRARNAQAGHIELFCPILRDDQGGSALPSVSVEFNHYVIGGSTALDCTLYWQEEDANSGSTRGIAEYKSTDTAGVGQFIWNDLADYTNGTGTMSLSSGGEGTIVLVCDLGFGDEINQYSVEENLY
jgi:hypothetical protein